jgi:hypothetical protein
MPKDELPPEPGSLEKWHDLPQSTPSRDAMPPVAGGLGGLRWLWPILIITAIVIMLGLLAQLQL